MRRAAALTACALAATLLVACSSDQEDKPPPPEKTVFRADIKALHKAQAVDMTVAAQKALLDQQMKAQEQGQSDQQPPG